jgi:hypothetical protein
MAMTIETSAKPESLLSRGGKNHKEDFEIKLTGKQIYDLLDLLETRAIKEMCYLDVRQAVAFSELVREQARAQGF